MFFVFLGVLFEIRSSNASDELPMMNAFRYGFVTHFFLLSFPLLPETFYY
jgi:hypothetical protein